jgi:phospholipid/cholesterol/gamma-HCH transport system substrate-binding protein
METRAPYALIGLFVLAAIGAGFGFVYWLNNAGGLGKREVYQIRFENTVSGLLTGAAVLFNGIRVGEVTDLTLDPAHPTRVIATVAVAAGTPVRADTRAGLDFQGLTGVPVVTLEGGSEPLPRRTDGAPSMIKADADAGLSMTRAAREALVRLEKLLADNADPLHDAIVNINTFAEALARNSGRVDGILKGLEGLTGGGAEAKPVQYDLTLPMAFPGVDKPVSVPMVVPEPTTVLLYDTQKVLVRPANDLDPSFEQARWADSLPKLIQARIVQSFENANSLGLVTKPIDGLTPQYQLLIDLRRFQVTATDRPLADIAFSAKIMTEDGKIVASKLFQVTAPAKVTDAAAAAAALDAAFQKAVAELVAWTGSAL